MALTSELKDAANHILSHAQGIEATLVLARAVEKTNLIEQAATEADRRATAAKSAKAAAEKGLAEVEASIGKAKDQLAEIRALGRQAKADADKQASEIVAKAKADATAEQDSIRAGAQKGLDDLRRQAAGAQADLDAVKAEIVVQQNKLKAVKAEQAAVVKSADEARAYLKSLAGA